MSLIVTGTIGIDTIHTPTGSAESVLGGSCTYFAAAASFFTPVRIVAAVGGDFTTEHEKVFAAFPTVCCQGLDRRPQSKTFAWGGRYLDDMNQRETLYTHLGVLEEAPPIPPEVYRDSRFVFLANTHPGVQRGLLEHFPARTLAVADTMNLWIDIASDELKALLTSVDGLVLNDEEARMLTGSRNNIDAGRRILDMGPRFAIIKKGEHGSILVHRDGVAAIPAYPTDVVIDPTGAGDSFAGGLMGRLASTTAADPLSLEEIQKAMAVGSVVASFTIESFSLERLTTLQRAEIDGRAQEFARMVRV
ncbi:MAG: sugar kinase [Phycisphaerales bacterium]|nr:MAG: sugar kinase [Phycisphaerales bacterium]